MKSEIYTVYSRLTMVTFQIRNSQTNTPASRISRDFWTHLSYPFIKIQPCFLLGPGVATLPFAVPLPPNCPTWSGGIGKDITLEVPRRIKGWSFQV